ncbi:MarR family winged helix-turn-helix transcriptional regulator [Phyllobacterium sophorae]|jgi:DNA-binding MarR family transcriptional regulator|uniref:MarR family transcriptional regulator n=1 Tax=Phyllobacterium sophorae TaxID=1520277 RepID=A0A2P7ATN8_9HYPH|nr:MarR family transcriptional regulator [Phyllobacterium sophorae]PSH57595.1 MarR family transcriptional regulator [Phyllobacterium sophorae]
MSDPDQRSSAATSPSPALVKQSLRVWLKMLKATKHVEATVREKLRIEFDTTLPRFDVMAALYRFEEGLKMSELSSALRVSNGNVTGIIERLVADGAVLRVPVAGDKRAMLVRLTHKGREEFAKMAAAHQLWINEIFGSLSPDTTARLISMLDTIEHSQGLSPGEDQDA